MIVSLRDNHMWSPFNKKDVTKMTIDEIVLDIAKNESTKEIISNKREDLILLHHSSGMWIRNTYKLWERSWEPEIRDGVDYSPNHPDAISQVIIEKLYDHWLNEESKKELTKL